MKTPEILGKPSGVTLEEHTSNVRREAAQVLSARVFPLQKYRDLFGDNLRAIVDEIALWHDEGKKHPRWQEACRKDFAEFWAWMQSNYPRVERKDAAPYFSRFKADSKNAAQNLRVAQLRHEFHSLVLRRKSKPLPPILHYVAIAAHHAKLSEKQKKRFDDDAQFAIWRDKFFKEWGAADGDDLLAGNFEKFVLKRYQFDGPRAVLQLADHRASARENGETLPKLEPFDYFFPHATKQGVQEIITQLWDEPLAILRAPTGAGKTDAALLWAQHQIDLGRADRLIIAMPTRFTSNALALGAKENLSNVGIYHSTSYFNRKSRESEEPDFNDRWIQKENELARLIETPACVTTLDHLCIALTGAREDHHSIFWGMAQSCVVIDEADFYDEFTQYNLVTLLRALKELKVPVLIMSATVPDSSLELYSQAGTPISRIYEDKSDLTRPRCEVFLDDSAETPDDVALLLERALKGEPTIIYANTVKRAQAYCDWLKHREFDDFVLYHSRFTEPDKARKEEQLISMLGKTAWAEGTQHGVAVLTQIGELSVNISADLMISDFCPLDRLAQRAGRLARFGLKVGELHVVTPMKTDKSGVQQFYPAPYGEFHGTSGWIASLALEKSRSWLTSGVKSAQDWIDGVNFVYDKLGTPSTRTQRNRKELESRLITSWMIVRVNEADEDDTAVGKWKCRNIPAQQKVYVCEWKTNIVDGENEMSFPYWRKFREWETEHAISVLSYEVKLGCECGTVESIRVVIGEDVEQIFIADNKSYNFARGLVLTPQQDESEDDDL